VLIDLTYIIHAKKKAENKKTKLAKYVPNMFP
jgi:hypothetical protein